MGGVDDDCVGGVDCGTDSEEEICAVYEGNFEKAEGKLGWGIELVLGLLLATLLILPPLIALGIFV